MAQLPEGEPAPSDGALPAAALARTDPISLYVHVPFCLTRCGYCDFNTYTAAELGGDSTGGFLAAIDQELDLAARFVGDRKVDTIFFGGGTPTMLPAQELAGLLGGIQERFELTREAEITTEANPETVSVEYFEQLRSAGFTRVSLGLQSVVPHVLRVLERAHSAQRGLDAASWAVSAGFEHVSLDLIYGTPGETQSDWERSLDAVLAAPVDHVSAYSLIVEEGTRLGRQVSRGEVPMPDDDDLADKYLIAEEKLASFGLSNYEVSNWARQGGQCRHNLAYWRGADWWGFGPGAHSHLGGVRFWNRKHPRSYAASLAAGESPALAREVLTAEQRRIERVLLELRLSEGLQTAVLTATELARVPDLLRRGLLTEQPGSVRLTLPGRLLADGVIRDLLD